jgi:membrane fusion protein, multidrug efflux system
MKKKWMFAGAGVLVAAGAVGTVWWLQTGAEAAASPAPAVQAKAPTPLEFSPREVVQPQLARLSTAIEFSGPLVAPQTAIVRAKAGGTLLQLSVREGDRVRAGQALGRLDLSDISTRVEERAAMVESARASMAQAERTHASNERLAAQQFISPVALDNSRSALEVARAQLGAAQASLNTSRVALRDAALVAPIAGIVAKRSVVPGERLAPEQPVLTIVDVARLELAGQVGVHEVARLRPGVAVQVQVEGLEAPIAGTLARIAPAAEPGTRAIAVAIDIPNAKEQLRAGQYGRARVQLEDGAEQLTVPLSAVASTAGQDHVWVIDGGKLLRRAVQLGRRDERGSAAAGTAGAGEARVEVLAGLAPASQVLAVRFDNLREGTPAAVAAGRAAKVASAAASTPAVR